MCQPREGKELVIHGEELIVEGFLEEVATIQERGQCEVHITPSVSQPPLLLSLPRPTVAHRRMHIPGLSAKPGGLSSCVTMVTVS
jgi:hypothetical protein